MDHVQQQSRDAEQRTALAYCAGCAALLITLVCVAARAGDVVVDQGPPRPDVSWPSSPIGTVSCRYNRLACEKVAAAEPRGGGGEEKKEDGTEENLTTTTLTVGKNPPRRVFGHNS